MSAALGKPAAELEAAAAEMKRLLEVLQAAVGNAALHGREYYRAGVRGGLHEELFELDGRIGALLDAFEDDAFSQELGT